MLALKNFQALTRRVCLEPVNQNFASAKLFTTGKSLVEWGIYGMDNFHRFSVSSRRFQRLNMKVYIQDIETGRYFKNPFVWVDDKSTAYNFVTSLEAFDFCLQMNCGRGARILLSFDDPRHDVCLFAFEPAAAKAEAEVSMQVHAVRDSERELAVA